MNTETIQATRVDVLINPGDFKFSEEFDCLYIILPGQKNPDAIPIQKGEQGGYRVWGWDGDVDKPTLTPSIHLLNQWHGWLQSGILKSC